MASKNKKEAIISAAAMATVSDVINLTNDRVEALAGGHGMVNMAVFSIANVIVEEVLQGGDISMQFANRRHLPLEAIITRAIKAAVKSGADKTNAALLTAACIYLAGSAAQAGIPAGNRKLGATARMLAGVCRSGVAMIPTAKMNNKISGFPAVQAIYQAMMEGRLAPVDGRKIPPNVAGGPMYGHSALGEDLIWPAMARNGARIGTQAMLDAMAGAAMLPHPFTAAILGAAAILEIIHPDAEVAETHGEYGKVNSAYLVGQAAAATAGLPARLHLKVTGQAYDTARLVGDVGLILKDVGAPSVIGMMALEEIFAAFKENIAGFSGGPVNAPLGHVAAYAVVAMKVLLENGGRIVEAAEAIARERAACSFDPESAFISLNIVTRKAKEIQGGPVSETLILASEPPKARAIYQRAEFTYEALESGRSLSEVVRSLEDQRLAQVEKYAGRVLSSMTGQTVKIKVAKIAGGARRSSGKAKKYWAFDPLADVEVTVGDKTATMKNFIYEIIPDICQGRRDDLAWAAPLAAAVMSELTLAGCNIINVVTPAAVAAAMGRHIPVDAAELGAEAAYITAGIPGLNRSAAAVADLAVRIIGFELDE